MNPSEILTAVRAWANHHPDALATQDHVRALTYAQFIDEIHSVSHALLSMGAKRGQPIVTCLGNTVSHVVCMYACLNIGCPFVPVAEGSPAARTRQLLDQVRPALLISCDDMTDVIRDLNIAVISYEQLQCGPADFVSFEISSNEPAYVLFTSGSSGTPKGVVIPRGSLCTGIMTAMRAFDLNAQTRAMVIGSFHFDGSLSFVFGVPSAGGTLFVSRASHLTPVEYLDQLGGRRISHTSFSPSFLKTLIPVLDRADGRFLRTAGIGGEDCNKADIEAFLHAFPQVRAFNRYGPTEATIAVSSFQITQETLRESSKIPLGKPHAPVAAFSSRVPNAAESQGHREFLRGMMAGRLELPS